MTPASRQPDQVQTFNNGAYANWGMPPNMKANTVPGTALPPAPDPMQNPLARNNGGFNGTYGPLPAGMDPNKLIGVPDPWSGIGDAGPFPSTAPDPNKMIGVPDPSGGIGDAGPIPAGYGPGQNPFAMPGGPAGNPALQGSQTATSVGGGNGASPTNLGAPQGGQSDQARLLAAMGFSPAQVSAVTGGSAPPAAPPPAGVTTFQNMYQNAGTLPAGSNPFPTQRPGANAPAYPGGSPGGPGMSSASFNPNAQPSSPGSNPGVQTFQNGAYATQGNGQAQPSGGITPPRAMDTGSMLPGSFGGGFSPSTGVDGNGQISGVPGMPLGQVQGGINTSNVPSLVGGDALSSQMSTAQQAAYKQAAGYLDPQFANQQNALQNQLVNQGIPQNSEAWNKAMDDFNRQKTFAYQQAQSGAVQQGNQAQAQLFGQGLAANQNQFGQNAAAGSFTNSAQQQQVQQILQSLGFNEGVNQNNFANSMGMRQQDLNELLLQQQNPLQMFQALSGGNNVTSPQFSQTPGATVGGTDIASIIAQALGQQNSVFNSQVGATNSANSGTASIAAAVIAGLLSDRRLKKNVRMIGMHEAGVPLYAFDYVWDKPGIGVMADELKHVMPDAVFTTPSGYEAVDYAKLSRVE